MSYLLGVFGNPIAHSRSPDIHHQFAQSAGLDVNYEKILVPDGEFENTAQGFIARGARGFNITVPNKLDAYEFANNLSAAAKAAGAVNTIKREENGDLSGHNTDGAGLVRDLKQRLGWTLEAKRILILGAGGAVQGALAALIEESPGAIEIYNRTHAKAEALVARFAQANLRAVNLAQLGEGYDVIISGSSAGLSQGAGFSLPERIIGGHSQCYDMIYGKEPTAFMVWAETAGAKTLADGLGMLVEQAAIAFEYWFEEELQHPVETHDVYQRLREILVSA